MKDERCIQLIQNEKLPSYELPSIEKDGSVSVHHRNIQSLATEILYGQSREVVTDSFYTGYTGAEFQKISRLQDTFCEHSVSVFCKHFPVKSPKIEKSLQ